LFGCNFAPQGWAMCQGQILPISQYSALFSLLGTQFGGNGTSNFALPDLRSRIPMGQGNGSGLTPRAVGETRGGEGVTLTTGQLPAHNHGFLVSDGTATTNAPSGGTFARPNVNP